MEGILRPFNLFPPHKTCPNNPTLLIIMLSLRTEWFLQGSCTVDGRHLGTLALEGKCSCHFQDITPNNSPFFNFKQNTNICINDTSITSSKHSIHGRIVRRCNKYTYKSYKYTSISSNIIFYILLHYRVHQVVQVTGTSSIPKSSFFAAASRGIMVLPPCSKGKISTIGAASAS